MSKSHKIVIDTNLWISFLPTGKFDFIDHLLENGNIKLVFSEELLLEFIEVSERPKFRKFFSLDDLKEILQTIEQYAIYISVTSTTTDCRDKKDNFLLSLAKDSNADYLITGDKDLLVLKSFEKTKITTITEYLLTVR